jgi:hypothetical protein
MRLDMRIFILYAVADVISIDISLPVQKRTNEKITPADCCYDPDILEPI